MKKKEQSSGISFFEKNLTVWVALCMVAGVLIGKFLPAIPDFLSQFEYARVSIPIAVLIWLLPKILTCLYGSATIFMATPTKWIPFVPNTTGWQQKLNFKT